eukprot:12835004-Alexandrium_andersonii.AAC.1
MPRDCRSPRLRALPNTVGHSAAQTVTRLWTRRGTLTVPSSSTLGWSPSSCRCRRAAAGP